MVPFTLASRGSRVGALLIDLLCMVASLILAAVAIGYTAGGLRDIDRHLRGGSAQDHAMQALFALWIIVGFLIRNAWFMAFELGPRGATPGKRLLRIRIAARDGARLTPERVIARNLLRDIEIFLPLTMLASSMGEGDSTAGWPPAGFALCAVSAVQPRPAAGGRSYRRDLGGRAPPQAAGPRHDRAQRRNPAGGLSLP
jgi:uncharacterized RDD family membrane protein YckC